MKLNKGIDFYVNVVTYIVVALLIIWWVNGCSTTWLEQRPSEEEKRAIMDSIARRDTVFERNTYILHHSEVDELLAREYLDAEHVHVESDCVRITLKGRGQGNEFDAIPDIIVKKWSNHNGDIKACRKQFVETELKLHGVKKIGSDYFSDIIFLQKTVCIYTTSSIALTEKDNMEHFVKKLRTKVRDCGCNRIRFYFVPNEFYPDKYPPKLMGEYIDNGDEFTASEAFAKEWHRNYVQEQREKAREYEEYLDNKD